MIISEIVWPMNESFASQKDTTRPRYRKRKKPASFSAFSTLYWTQLCSYWCESASSSVKSKEKSIQSVWPSDSLPFC